MKNISLGLNILLTISVIVLYYLHFNTNTKNVENHPPQIIHTGGSSVNFAYIEVDSLLKNYQFHKDLTTKLLSKKQNSENELNTKVLKLQKEMDDFQKNVQSGLISTETLARSEQERLMRKEQDLLKLKEELHYQLLQEEQKMTIQLNDSILSFVKKFNDTYQYQFILSKTFGGNLLLANDSLNITNSIIKGLNEKYQNENK